jgi:DNA-binding transcriptional ArsR family regulator
MIKLSYEQKIREVSTWLEALANPLRLKLFRLLAEGDFCVCELQRLLEVEQSRLSHQLRLLRLSGLIEAKEEGRWSVYSMAPKWKKHPLVVALKEALPMEALEKEAIERTKRESLRLKRLTPAQV